mmetsp:Transcript_54231/g.128086  ORF Transcript_54231/g.128086 Transcript_54231/m.128086 type:complete len:745 (-) Transcript_54231:116-2350(-)
MQERALKICEKTLQQQTLPTVLLSILASRLRDELGSAYKFFKKQNPKLILLLTKRPDKFRIEGSGSNVRVGLQIQPKQPQDGVQRLQSGRDLNSGAPQAQVRTQSGIPHNISPRQTPTSSQAAVSEKAQAAVSEKAQAAISERVQTQGALEILEKVLRKFNPCLLLVSQLQTSLREGLGDAYESFRRHNPQLELFLEVHSDKFRLVGSATALRVGLQKQARQRHVQAAPTVTGTAAPVVATHATSNLVVAGRQGVLDTAVVGKMHSAVGRRAAVGPSTGVLGTTQAVVGQVGSQDVVGGVQGDVVGTTQATQVVGGGPLGPSHIAEPIRPSVAAVNVVRAGEEDMDWCETSPAIKHRGESVAIGCEPKRPRARKLLGDLTGDGATSQREREAAWRVARDALADMDKAAPVPCLSHNAATREPASGGQCQQSEVVPKQLVKSPTASTQQQGDSERVREAAPGVVTEPDASCQQDCQHSSGEVPKQLDKDPTARTAGTQHPKGEQDAAWGVAPNAELDKEPQSCEEDCQQLPEEMPEQMDKGQTARTPGTKQGEKRQTPEIVEPQVTDVQMPVEKRPRFHLGSREDGLTDCMDTEVATGDEAASSDKDCAPVNETALSIDQTPPKSPTRLSCILVGGQFVADVALVVKNASDSSAINFPSSIDFQSCVDQGSDALDVFHTASLRFGVVANDPIGKVALTHLTQHIGSRIAVGTLESGSCVLLQVLKEDLQLCIVAQPLPVPANVAP